MKKQLIVLAVIAIIIAGIAAMWFASSDSSNQAGSEQVGVPGEPLDLTLEFYQEWRALAAGTSTDPYATLRTESPLLTTELKATLATTTRTPNGLDAVLCQATVPERLAGRILYELENAAQVTMVPRGGEEKSPHWAVVTLERANAESGWQITTIECTNGESGPEVEYSVDREGFLLKSVPEPYEAGQWHLIFEQMGQLGYVVPLFFDESTTCIQLDGSEAVCDPDTFTEASRVRVQGQMLETGAELERVEFLPKEE